MPGTEPIDLSPEILTAAAESKAWPFEEAKKIVDRYAKRGYPETVLFETGYGPSGLPHIGTFGEVARTTMVRHAFRVLTEDKVKTRLLCFSDDMDGLRKVPDNVPNKEMLRAYLGKPLTRVPDPFSNEYPSFGAANNARLRGFLDRFGFDYEFASVDRLLPSGRFDATLLKMLERYDKVMAIMLPSLREEREQSYSPFLPIHPKTGIVMQVPIDERKVGAGTIVWRDPDTGERFETPVTGGHAKLQWKPDWAMRWAALGVDYEMSGKDLIDSVKLPARSAARSTRRPPEGFNYELFLDENGQKISKSKGNGLTIDEWLTYAPTESLGLYMFQKPTDGEEALFRRHPQGGRRVLHVPRRLSAAGVARSGSAIRSGTCMTAIRLSSTCRCRSRCCSIWSAPPTPRTGTVLWGFISRYAPGVTPETHPELDRLAGYAIRYFEDFVKPAKVYRAADEVERRGAGQAARKRLPRCRRTPMARRSRTPRSTSRARSSAIRTIPSRARKAGRACRSPSSR